MFFTLLPTGFDKCWVERWCIAACHGGDDGHLRLPLVLVGSLKLLPTGLNGRKISHWSALNETARRFIQSPPRCSFFKEPFLFANIFYGLFPRWIPEMNPIGSGKCSVPHARLPHLCTCNLIQANSTSDTYTGQQGETQSSINSWCDWGGLTDRTQKRITFGRTVGGRIVRPLRVRVMVELLPGQARP